MKNSIFMILLGIFMKILDEIYDSKIFPEYKNVFEILCLLVLVCVYTSDVYVSFFYSMCIVIYFISTFFYDTIVIEDFAWIAGICISIITFVYHLINFKSLINTLESKDINTVKYIGFPLIIISIYIFYLEHIYIPEERSNNKLLSRIIAAIIISMCYIILNFTQFNKYFFYDSDIFINCSNSFIFLGFGYIFTSVLFLSVFSSVYHNIDTIPPIKNITT
jgi:hypothetical protein